MEDSTLGHYDRLYHYMVIRLHGYTIILRWNSMEDSMLRLYDRLYGYTVIPLYGYSTLGHYDRLYGYTIIWLYGYTVIPLFYAGTL